MTKNKNPVVPTLEEIEKMPIESVVALALQYTDGTVVGTLSTRASVVVGRLIDCINAQRANEKTLRKALQRLLNARVGGTVTDQKNAQRKGEEALEESFAAQHEAGDVLRAALPCLDPNKMHGAGDQFPGSDYGEFDPDPII